MATSVFAREESEHWAMASNACADTQRPPAALLAPFSADAARSARQAWANHLGKPAMYQEPATGMVFVLIPPGEFMMGGATSDREVVGRLYPGGKEDWFADETSHRVRINKPFYFAKHEVTVSQFRKFVETAQYRPESEADGEGGVGWNRTSHVIEGPRAVYSWRNPGFSQTDDHPVSNVSWNDALAFCNWLGTTSNQLFRLPSEAEWEYCCRAGTATAFWNGNDDNRVTEIGNVPDADAKKVMHAYINSYKFFEGHDGYAFSSPVGKYAGNAFGLHDVHGNVAEWCADWYSPKFYVEAPVNDPLNNASGKFRVYRGGAWSGGSPSFCRSAYRGKALPKSRIAYVGFRVVLELRV